MTHIHEVKISFGDCDPAGIVFYPNTFRWMDATFHDFLRQHGGHAAICADLGATGIGLVDAGAQFRSPMLDGNLLALHMDIAEWGKRTISLSYRGMVGTRLAFEGREVRCLFTPSDKGIVAGDMGLLKARIEA